MAQWYEQNARDARKKDAYAAHVKEGTKDNDMLKQYAWADKVRLQENLHNFSVWQRVNQQLTGECIAFLPR